MTIPMEGDAEPKRHLNPEPSPQAIRLAQVFFKPLGIAPETWEQEIFDELLKEHSEKVIAEVISYAQATPFWCTRLDVPVLRRNFRKILLQCRSVNLCKTKTTKSKDPRFDFNGSPDTIFTTQETI